MLAGTTIVVTWKRSVMVGVPRHEALHRPAREGGVPPPV